jgi:hypothetical protein
MKSDVTFKLWVKKYIPIEDVRYAIMTMGPLWMELPAFFMKPDDPSPGSPDPMPSDMREVEVTISVEEPA